MQTENFPRVGVGVMVLREGKVLLGLRKGATAAGEYSFPGGHLEHLETFEACAKREVSEECGVTISEPEFLYVANLRKYAPKHYVHIGLVAEWKEGEPQVLEPERCEGWGWYPLEALPPNLDITCRMGLESYRAGKRYFDA